MPTYCSNLPTLGRQHYFMLVAPTTHPPCRIVTPIAPLNVRSVCVARIVAVVVLWVFFMEMELAE